MKNDHPEIKFGKTGVLLINLGTPDSTSWWDIRKYLKEFLSDRRVIEVNPILWKVILNLFILTFRPSKTAKAYKEIWMQDKDMSPLRYYTLMQSQKLADKFNIPIITFIDTPGAYPGVGAEERGQAEAIARSIESCMKLKVPNIAIIIGEGGSGGAIALASASKVIMLENSIYSVISPEGCASILWRDPGKSLEAAEAMKLSAQDLLKLGVIDDIIPEPLGGAHRNPSEVFKSLKIELKKTIEDLRKKTKITLSKERKQKYLKFGSNFSL